MFYYLINIKKQNRKQPSTVNVADLVSDNRQGCSPAMLGEFWCICKRFIFYFDFTFKLQNFCLVLMHFKLM